MIDQVTDANATAPIQHSVSRSTSDLLTNFAPVCPQCQHPYASNFAGMAHALVGKAVCNGSMVHELCRPTIYHVFPLPLTALSMDIEINGKRYRGVLYETEKEGES